MQRSSVYTIDAHVIESYQKLQIFHEESIKIDIRKIFKNEDLCEKIDENSSHFDNFASKWKVKELPIRLGGPQSR